MSTMLWFSGYLFVCGLRDKEDFRSCGPIVLLIFWPYVLGCAARKAFKL